MSMEVYSACIQYRVHTLRLLMICQFILPGNIVSALFRSMKANNMIYNLTYFRMRYYQRLKTFSLSLVITYIINY